MTWMKDGERYSRMEPNAETGGMDIVAYRAKDNRREVIIPSSMFINKETGKPIAIRSISWSTDNGKVLIYNNTKRVWRYDTRGDYWVLTLKDGTLRQLGKGLPESSMMFAKFSPDGTRVAFVSNNNIYVEDVASGQITQLTHDGSQTIVNGTFDWVYEEEFGFDRALEFSADNTLIAFIRFDESEVPSYSFPVFAGQAPRIDALKDYPGEYTYKYPKAGYPNSKVEVRTYDIKSHVTRTMKLPLDADGYIPRIRFTKDANKLAIIKPSSRPFRPLLCRSSLNTLQTNAP